MKEFNKKVNESVSFQFQAEDFIPKEFGDNETLRRDADILYEITQQPEELLFNKTIPFLEREGHLADFKTYYTRHLDMLFKLIRGKLSEHDSKSIVRIYIYIYLQKVETPTLKVVSEAIKCHLNPDVIKNKIAGAGDFQLMCKYLYLLANQYLEKNN